MKKTLLTLACAISASPALALNINFTGYENNSFFGAEQLEILNLAAWQYENRITDDVTINVRLYTDSTLDMTYPYALAEGGPSWRSTGNINVTNITGGSINYNVGGNFGARSFSDFDLYSLTLHELGHVLGIVSRFAPWNNLLTTIDGELWFTGEYSVGIYGGLVPVTVDGSHWDSSRWNFGSEIYPAMFTVLYPGQIQPLSELDYAALADMGWNVTFVPEPETWAMLLAGFGIVGTIATKRRRVAV